MATSYKTPGVYINEVSTLPASVAQVPTAIPAFVGYTEFATDTDSSSLLNTPKRITSMVEYVQFFGGSAKATGTLGLDDLPKVTLDEDNGFSVSEIEIALKYVMYQSMSLYFANGGGACYVVSVGGYDDYALADAFMAVDIMAGLTTLENEDEPTIILAPDAGMMADPIELGSVQKAMLIQCNKLQDRFAIMDLIEDASTDELGEGDFRTEVGMQYLKYGAAYGPHLETSLSYDLPYNDLVIEDGSGDVKETGLFNASVEGEINVALDDLALIEANEGGTYLIDFDGIATASTSNLKDKMLVIIEAANDMRTLMDTMTNLDIILGVASSVEVGSELETIVRQVRSYSEGYDALATATTTTLVFGSNPFDGFDLASFPSTMIEADFDYLLGTGIVPDNSIFTGTLVGDRVAAANPVLRSLLVDLLSIYSDISDEAERILTLLEESLVSVDPIYAGIKRAIAAKGIIVPPSGAVAGAYVATDANRGVWKAPANVSLNNVVRPTIKVDNATQEGLNVDATSGKSINVIRSFTGKGILIWGARTLAGNDNEWRYVPVRRLFITVEESVKKATEFVVFEPNDGNTWLRTKTMIQNYLTGLWRQGALAGAKPEDAFFVNVGLGTTMTAQDILEGKLIVEIGLAAVRPAEFIILRFSHKLQES